MSIQLNNHFNHLSSAHLDQIVHEESQTRLVSWNNKCNLNAMHYVVYHFRDRGFGVTLDNDVQWAMVFTFFWSFLILFKLCKYVGVEWFVFLPFSSSFIFLFLSWKSLSEWMSFFCSLPSKFCMWFTIGWVGWRIYN